MPNLRLQKFLADCGVASRRKCEELISDHRVRVNGRVADKLGVKIDPKHDRVEVDGEVVYAKHLGILLFHKPTGVISTMSDERGRKCIADFLTPRYRSYFPVGRLDRDSSGLMILTNDGDLAEKLLHPRHESERIYHATLEGVPDDKTLEKMEKGVRLEDGLARAKGKIIGAENGLSLLEIVIKEGRNRVVRRMMEKLRHPVLKLKRVKHGPFSIGRIKRGQIKNLTEREYQEARKSLLARVE